MARGELDNDELSVILPSSSSSVSVSLHPLPILNISDHLTRSKLQSNFTSPFVLGALLGTQNGRNVEIVNSFELAVEGTPISVDHGFLISRRDQYKQVFPSLEFIGWYTVAEHLSSFHITLHEQFTGYTTTPLLLVLQPHITTISDNVNSHTLPFKAYEPSIEIRDRKSRSVFIEVPYTVETGEAERIAVDWTSRGGGSGTSFETHLQTQRAAVNMLHERILLLVKYLTDIAADRVAKDDGVLRSLTALAASLPAIEAIGFRNEFDTEYEDVQLTGFLSSLTKVTNALNDAVDKHAVITSGRDDRGSCRKRSAARNVVLPELDRNFA